MANKRGKKIDKTHLSLDQATARGFLHRDYIAHVFRWSYVVKHVTRTKNRDSMKILDVGCGVEQPLPRTLYSSRVYPKLDQGGLYVGVDYNKLEPNPMFANAGNLSLKVFGECVFPDNFEEKVKNQGVPESFDLITSFEVLEHVEPAGTYKILKGIFDRLAADGYAIISTPCYDPKVGAADNHVNEMSYQGLGSMIEHIGFEVEKTYGTFASQSDYKPLMTPAQLEIYDRLHEYYDSNVLATIFAPMFPEVSRNCLWVLKRADTTNLYRTRRFKNPSDVATVDHSSSEEWTTFMSSLEATK